MAAQRSLEPHGLRNYLLLWPGMLAVMILPFQVLGLVRWGIDWLGAHL